MEKENKEMNIKNENKEMNIKNETMDSRGFESFEDAFKTGYKQGMIAGYSRACSGVIKTIARLQDLFLENMKGGTP